MSYNYLPLDRKWLNFQQVKNLLDYNQLVSITFDAHERILKCREYVDNLSTDNVHDQLDQSQDDILKHNAVGIGEEVPAEIVKLMLMLKIKSLSYGNSGAHIETVKRLMKMYNNDVFPVVYSQASSSTCGDTIALSLLNLPLIGLGEVYYRGQKRLCREVFVDLTWQPLTLKSNEGAALVSGTHFTSAYGLYALKQAEQLIKFADAIAALSFYQFGCSIESLHPKIQSTHNGKGQMETAAAILRYLASSEIEPNKNHPLETPYSFRCISQVHGSAKDTFDYVLNVFLKEINSVTENPVFFPDENLMLSGGSFHGQPLANALDFLSIVMCELANISERRTAQLLNEQKGLKLTSNKALQYAAVALSNENKLLCTPASINIVSANSLEDYVSLPGTAATKCLRLISNVGKILAIELMSVAYPVEGTKEKTPSFLRQLLLDFEQQVSFKDEEHLLNEKLVKAGEFISSYKL